MSIATHVRMPVNSCIHPPNQMFTTPAQYFVVTLFHFLPYVWGGLLTMTKAICVISTCVLCSIHYYIAFT